MWTVLESALEEADCYRKGIGVKLKSAICVHNQLLNQVNTFL